jgi:tRNA pseudouridine13 synthase
MGALDSPATLAPGAESFRVTELPAYAPCGAGEHLWIEIEKQDLTTDAVAEALAGACGRALRDVGFAGRKDRHGVTRQWFSVHFGEERQLAQLAAPARGARLEVLGVSRHRNKLRLGHLRANRFELRLEGLSGARIAELEAGLARVAREGLANRFGAQRFGVARSTLAIARAWAEGDCARAAARLLDPLGGWKPGDPLPRGFRPGHAGRVLGALRRDPHDFAGALRAAGGAFAKFVASAAQAAVFNAVLDARHDAGLLHRLRAGDVALSARGAPFAVSADDLDDVNRRAAAGVLEVRATGPLPGPARRLPDARVLAEEREWSAHVGVDWSWFERGAVFASAGERRPLVVVCVEPPVLRGSELGFALPAGSYATELLAELGIAVPERRG